MVLERGLSPQEMEVLRRRRAVGDPDVLVRRELQKALEAGAGVLGSLALVAVRQEHHEPRGLAPLGLPGDDELVDYGLRYVHEVPVLGLPQHERLLSVQRVTILEPQG